MGNWRIMAEDHWKKHLPEYYRDLQEKGILEQTLDQAEKNMTEALLTLVSDQGMNMAEAREILLQQYILLPPEPEQTPGATTG